MDARFKRIHVSMPGQVQRYDPVKQLVDVLPVMSYRTKAEGGSGRDLILNYPVITNVPLMFPSAGGYQMTFPVRVSDSVLLVFSESSLSRWINQENAIATPIDQIDHSSRFSINDAIAIPGLRVFSDSLNAPTDRMTIGVSGGLQIHVTPSTVLLGGTDATDRSISGDAIYAAASALKTTVQTAAATCAGAPGVVDAGARTFAADLATAMVTFASAVSAARSDSVKIKP